MERAKPTTKQSLVVRSPQSCLSEDSFGAAQPQAGMMEPTGSRDWLWSLEEHTRAALQLSPPSSLPASVWASSQKPHKAFSWRNVCGEAFGAYTGRRALLSICFLQHRQALGLMEKGWTAGKSGCDEQEPAIMSLLHNTGWI